MSSIRFLTLAGLSMLAEPAVADPIRLQCQPERMCSSASDCREGDVHFAVTLSDDASAVDVGREGNMLPGRLLRPGAYELVDELAPQFSRFLFLSESNDRFTRLVLMAGNGGWIADSGDCLAVE